MIFNTFTYYFCYLFPAAVLFRITSPALRPWVCIIFGSLFFVFFSFTSVFVGFLCLLMFYWECFVSRLYRPKSWVCIFGIVQAVAILSVFKYWNFLTGLPFHWVGKPNPIHWSSAFLPLGISFFTFEFIHYAADRYKGQDRGRDRSSSISGLPSRFSPRSSRDRSSATRIFSPGCARPARTGERIGIGA